ncbi:RICIN domain-containing protein [Streptacidiphilus sp. MAP12-20]|uniref:RICIN domain-containing protein n=1 Tax=Streptacidiphilus sp. MAP12-20 TaxID=3156299 RepID=UPI00351221F4
MDRVVRVLATACDRENRGVPVAHAIVVGPDSVRFHLKTPDERPPTGWTADLGGRTWQAPLRRLQSAGVAESLPEPYPRLVSLGHNSKGFVLLNLSQAGGIVGLEGDARQARALAQDWTHELTTSPWSRDVQVVRVGFRPGTADPAGSTEAPTLADAEAALAAESGGVLLLASLPGGRDRERVYTLANDPEGRWSVVVVGRVEHPRWRFTIDAAGVVDTGILDEPVARRLDPGTTWDTPTEEDADAEAPGRPAGHPVGGAAPGGRRPEPAMAARRRIVIAAGVVACLVGATGVVLALQGSSSPSAHASAPVGNASTVPGVPQGAATSSPTPSTTPSSPPAASPSRASTAPVSAGRMLVNPGTGKCLSGGAGTDGTPLVLARCDGNVNQAWDVSPDGTLRSQGLCMDAAWGATSVGTVVQVARCSGNPAQQFSLVGDTIHSKMSNLCAGALNGGTGIRLFPCDRRPADAFKRH